MRRSGMIRGRMAIFKIALGGLLVASVAIGPALLVKYDNHASSIALSKTLPIDHSKTLPADNSNTLPIDH